VLAGLIRVAGVRDGFRRYNGAGPAAEAYADDAMARLARWRAYLATAPAPSSPAPPEVDMPLTPAEINAIADAVWRRPTRNGWGDTVGAEQILAGTEVRAADVQNEVHKPGRPRGWRAGWTWTRWPTGSSTGSRSGSAVCEPAPSGPRTVAGSAPQRSHSAVTARAGRAYATAAGLCWGRAGVPAVAPGPGATSAVTRAALTWLATATTTALITTAVCLIAFGSTAAVPAPPMQPAPVVAPLTTATGPRETVIVGKRADVGVDCYDPHVSGIDSTGSPTVCRPGVDGATWARPAPAKD
jgi:hypothetical protein